MEIIVIENKMLPHYDNQLFRNQPTLCNVFSWTLGFGHWDFSQMTLGFFHNTQHHYGNKSLLPVPCFWLPADNDR
jgi:hypothetical protein